MFVSNINDNKNLKLLCEQNISLEIIFIYNHIWMLELCYEHIFLATCNRIKAEYLKKNLINTHFYRCYLPAPCYQSCMKLLMYIFCLLKYLLVFGVFNNLKYKKENSKIKIAMCTRTSLHSQSHIKTIKKEHWTIKRGMGGWGHVIGFIIIITIIIVHSVLCST